MLYSLRFQARDLSVQFCTTAMSRGERKRGGADRRTKSPGNGRVEEREKVKREEGKREITEYIGQRRRERKRRRSIGDDWLSEFSQLSEGPFLIFWTRVVQFSDSGAG